MPNPNLDVLPQTTTKGGGEAYFEVLSDNKGPLAVPALFSVPELLDYQYEDKRDTKELMGSGRFPIALTAGKEIVTITLTMAAMFGELLNAAMYGAEQTNKMQRIIRDTVGYVVPDFTYVDAKIRHQVAVHIARWDSGVSVKIDGVTATIVTTAPIAGRCNVSNGKYTFAAEDKNKAFEITFISNGVTLIQTGKISADLVHDVKLFSPSKMTIRNHQTLMTRDKWSATSDTPETAHYQASQNGIIVLPADAGIQATKFMNINHWCSGQMVTTKIASEELPGPSYQVYVDPPTAASYVSHDSVSLVANSGAAMTGVAVGGDLAEASAVTTDFLVNHTGGYTTADNSIDVDTGTGNTVFAVGTIISFGTQTHKYAVVSKTDTSGDTTTIVLDRNLESAVADNAIIKSWSATGTYLQDTKGWYQFAPADAGDRVRLKFVKDYYTTNPVPRDARGNVIEGEFVKFWGIRNENGKPLQRVALTTPLSLSTDQYAVDESGAVYYDNTNAGERFYIDAEFEVDGGVHIDVMQERVGLAPLLRIALVSDDVNYQSAVFEQAMCEGAGVKTKADDNGDAYKFTFKCAVDRKTGRHHAVNMSS